MVCLNCDQSTGGYMTTKAGVFCGDCSGIAEALGIGSREPAFLYDGGEGTAITWGGCVMGTIVRHTKPGRWTFQPARYKVRMLDGSVWWGTGPASSGNYMRLRPMRGA